MLPLRWGRQLKSFHEPSFHQRIGSQTLSSASRTAFTELCFPGIAGWLVCKLAQSDQICSCWIKTNNLLVWLVHTICLNLFCHVGKPSYFLVGVLPIAMRGWSLSKNLDFPLGLGPRLFFLVHRHAVLPLVSNVSPMGKAGCSGRYKNLEIRGRMTTCHFNIILEYYGIGLPKDYLVL